MEVQNLFFFTMKYRHCRALVCRGLEIHHIRPCSSFNLRCSMHPNQGVSATAGLYPFPVKGLYTSETSQFNRCSWREKLSVPHLEFLDVPLCSCICLGNRHGK